MDPSLPAAGLSDAPGPLVPPPSDLGTQVAVLLDGAPAAPSAPSHMVKLKKKLSQRQRKKLKDREIVNQRMTLAKLIAQGDSALKVALAADIEESDPDLSSFAVSCLVMTNMDEKNLCRVGEMVKQDTKASYPELLKNEKLYHIALVSAALAFHVAKNNQKDFWKVFRNKMSPIVSSNNLHNKIKKAGESAMKFAFEEYFGKIYPNLLDPAKGFLIQANMADDRLNKFGEIVKPKMKKLYGEHLEKERLSNLALMWVGLDYECPKDNDVNRYENIILPMQPIISLNGLIQLTKDEGETALKSSLDGHFRKSYPDLSSLAIRFLVDTSMSNDKIKKVGEPFKQEIMSFYMCQQETVNKEDIAKMAAGMAYQRNGRDLSKFWKVFKYYMQPIVSSKILHM